MFCPNCGTNNPDNAVVCGTCGTPFAQAQPVYAQPTGAVMSKKDYFKNSPSNKAKSLSKIALILAVVLVVSIISTYFVTMNTSVDKIPFISMAVDESDLGDFDEMYDEADEMSDKLDDSYDKEKDEFSDEEQEVIEDFIEAAKDLGDCISISNCKAVLSASDDILEIDGIEILDDVASLSSELDDLIDAFNIISGVLIGFILFILIFAALGGFLKIRGLVIASLIFSLIHTFLLCGILWVIITAVIHIALIVVLTQRNAEYKNYKKSIGAM